MEIHMFGLITVPHIFPTGLPAHINPNLENQETTRLGHFPVAFQAGIELRLKNNPRKSVWRTLGTLYIRTGM